jgi:hypothetical protein
LVMFVLVFLACMLVLLHHHGVGDNFNSKFFNKWSNVFYTKLVVLSLWDFRGKLAIQN